MANSSHGNRVARALTTLGAAAVAFGLLGAAAAAQTPREEQKIVLDAVPLDINYRDNTAVFRDVVITQGDLRIQANEARVVGGLDFESGQWTVSGDVRISAEGGSLRSDKAVVSFRNKVIAEATITGSPAVFEQLRKDGSTSRGRANTINYVTASGTVSLRENAWLSDGCNEITGPSLVYNIRSQSVQGQPRATPGSDGRIRITIQPKGGSGTPCPKPESAPKP
jgi:lipopolysaccharide transport protein LptA